MPDFTWIQDLIIQNSAHWWVYPLAGLMCLIDGFFPPVPSESIVIAMTSLSRTAKTNLPMLLVFCFAGSFIGDNIAYWIGRKIPLKKLFKGDKGQMKIDGARKLMDGRTAQILMSAKFIPIYRVFINMTAGAIHVRYHRFVLLDLFAVSLWLTQAAAIGYFAGSLLHDNPLLGILIGVAVGVLAGLLIERIIHLINKRGGHIPESELDD